MLDVVDVLASFVPRLINLAFTSVVVSRSAPRCPSCTCGKQICNITCPMPRCDISCPDFPDSSLFGPFLILAFGSFLMSAFASEILVGLCCRRGVSSRLSLQVPREGVSSTPSGSSLKLDLLQAQPPDLLSEALAQLEYLQRRRDGYAR
jgi:hypothetical protein